MNEPLVQLTRDEHGVATVSLNRPRVHNAFDEHTIAALAGAFGDVADDAAVRVVLLRGNGPSFSAGGDAHWMQRMAAADRDENRRDALALAGMLRRLAAVPQPVIARAHGYVYGGAVGLLCACDIVIAAEDTRFALSEVRLGLVPAVISPWVIQAMGARQARRWFLTGESFDAATAHTLGLVHETVAAEHLDTRVDTVVHELLKAGPIAQREAKALVAELGRQPVHNPDAIDAHTSSLIATIRESEEGREGIGAFLEKRMPSWRE